MRYEGDIYRPPSEAWSLLVQVTIGCTHNSCTFCSMFKDKQFRVRPVEEVLEDLEDARKRYRRVEKMFLCDGDALCLSNRKLLVILDRIRALLEQYPDCDILIHCDAGISRSAGVAAAILEAWGGNPRTLFDSPWYEPNLHCYRVTLKALGAYGDAPV